jgi:hypothetical protein
VSLVRLRLLLYLIRLLFTCSADNTNRDVQTRKHYLDLAKRLQVPARYHPQAHCVASFTNWSQVFCLPGFD